MDTKQELFTLPQGSVVWAGGLSIILIPILSWQTEGNDFSWLNPFLLAAFSFSHFIMTAIWFYRHPAIRKQHPFVAFGSPFVMLAVAVGLYFASEQIVILAFRAGLFILYWHFAKQAFGVSLWMAGSRVRATPWLKQNLLLTTLLISAYGIMYVQTLSGSNQFFKLYMPNLELAPWTAHLFMVVAFLSFLVTAVGFYLKREPDAWVSWLKPLIPVIALWVWFEPRFFIAGIVTAPIFHGLQALPLTALHERGRWIKIASWGAAAVALGWILLTIVPGQIGAFDFARADRLAAIWIFVVNMHHFWLETYSWRGATRKLIENKQETLTNVNVETAA